MSIASIGDLNREIGFRCRDLGLKLDCGVDGMFNAEIAIIAEAPGEREKANKMPLCGGSGKFLWECLRPQGINRRSVYITNVCKRQLAQTKDSKDTIHKGELDHYIQLVRWELEQLPNLKYVVCLGSIALEAVTGLRGIENCRGSVYNVQLNSVRGDRRDLTVMAMYNPAYPMREPGKQIIFKFDVARLEKVILGEHVQMEVNTFINPSPTEALRWIDKMQDEKLPVGLDIETISRETACIGLGNTITDAMCINFRDAKSNRFTTQEEIQILLRLQKLADDQSTRFVMQNGMYDMSWLRYKDRLDLRRGWFDTILAHHTLYPLLPHNLGFLTSQYTTHPFYKDEGKQWREGGDIDNYWRYNGKDICVTLAVQQAEMRELRAQGMERFFFDYVMPLQPELVGMTVGGILVDQSLKSKITEELGATVARLKEEFQANAREAAGDDLLKVNPGSPKQLAELFFTKLRLTGRGVATDAANRKRMLAHPKTPPVAQKLIKSLDEYAKEKKFLSTYAESEIDVDGRFRSEYKQTGVSRAPGRLSSAETGWFTGSNLQNQPERAHPMFIADDGYQFTYFDLSQAEARVVAWRGNIASWMADFERARLEGNYDCHRSLASSMWNIPYDEVPKKDHDEFGEKTKRYIAKRCRHGLNYRMGPDRLAETTGLSLSASEDAYNIYHRTTPEVRQWWKATEEDVKKNRKLFSAYGRRWILLQPYTEDALESIVAFYPQSTIGDKVSRVIVQCHNDPEWPSKNARICLNIHDALIALHSFDVAAEVRGIMKKYAESPIPITDYHGNTRDLIIPAEFAISHPDEYGIHRWSTLKKE